MKKLIVSIAIATIACSAMAESSAPQGEKKASPHGSMTLKSSGATSRHDGMPASNAGMPANHPSGIASDTDLVNRGKVLEVIDSPMYSYVHVSTPRGSSWLAAYKMEIAKGETVRYSNGIAMANFHSKAIDRTFDTIIFVDTLEVIK